MSVFSPLLRLWTLLTYLPRWLWSKFWRKQVPSYRAETVEEFPESFKLHTVYLAGDSACLWGAAMLCPCGCGDAIELNLLQQVRPCWTAAVEADQSVSLHPSVWRKKGCGSHFFVRHGVIDWC